MMPGGSAFSRFVKTCEDAVSAFVRAHVEDHGTAEREAEAGENPELLHLC